MILFVRFQNFLKSVSPSRRALIKVAVWRTLSLTVGVTMTIILTGDVIGSIVLALAGVSVGLPLQWMFEYSWGRFFGES